MQITLTADTADTTVRAPGRKARWVKAITATLGPLNVTERSQAGARAALTAATDRLLSILRDPELITFGDATIVMYVSVVSGTPMFGYRIVRTERGATITVDAETWEEARSRAVHHLVQLGTKYLDDESVAAGAEFTRTHMGEEHVHAFLRDAAWQRAAQHAIDAGEVDYHRWAGDHVTDFYASVGLVA